MFRRGLSFNPGSWSKLHLRAFLAGFGILFMFNSNVPSKEKTRKQLQLQSAKNARVEYKYSAISDS